MFVRIFLILMISCSSQVSTQATYQRSCDCEYMLDGKCAYTLLLPTTNQDGGSCSVPPQNQTISDAVQNLTATVDMFYQMSLDQARLLAQLQGTIIFLQQSVINQTTIQVKLMEIDDLKTTTDTLSSQLNGLVNLVQLMKQNQSMNVTDLQDTVQLLKQATCVQRGPIFSGPNPLSGTSITFSSEYNTNYGADKVLITNTENTPGAWCPTQPGGDTSYQWIQFDMGRPLLVFGIATKGRIDYTQWITSYKIQYLPTGSNDSSTENFVYYQDIASEDEIFPGNTDQTTVQMNILWNAIKTRYIRLVPWTGYNVGNTCTRAEIMGCLDNF